MACAVWWGYYVKNFDGLTCDSRRYAGIARNIVKGKGFVEVEPWPIRFAYDIEPPFYVNRIPPVHPFMIAWLFYLFGISEEIVAYSSGIFFCLTVPLVYLFAESLFNKKVALMSAIFFVFDGTVLKYSISGLIEPTFTFFLLLSLYLLYKSVSYKQYLFSGAVFALSYLIRPEASIYFLLVLGYIWFGSDRKKHNNMLIFSVGFLTSIIPYLIWKYIRFGNPFFELNTFLLLRNTSTFPGDTIMRSLLADISPISFMLTHPQVFLGKLCSGINELYSSIFRLTNPYIMALFVVGVYKVINWENSRQERLRRLLYVLFLVQIIFTSLTSADQGTRFLTPFLPLIIIFSLEMVFSFLERKFKNKSFLLASAPLISLFVLFPTLYYGLYRGGTCETVSSSALPTIIKMVKENTGEDDIIVSSNSNEVAWFGERQSVALPISINTLKAINDNGTHIDAVLLTTLFSSYYHLPGDREWNEVLMNTEKIEGYHLVRKFQDGEVKALLFKKVQGDVYSKG